MQSSVDLSVFRDLVMMTPLQDEISRNQSTTTLLAPSDAAFAVVNIDRLKSNSAALSSLVAFHALDGFIDRPYLELGGEFNTRTSTTIRVVGGEQITFHDSQGGIARIVQGEIYASNGMIYVIDKVLQPPATSGD